MILLGQTIILSGQALANLLQSSHHTPQIWRGTCSPPNQAYPSTCQTSPLLGPYIYYFGAEPLTIHMVRTGRVRKHARLIRPPSARLPLVTYLRGGPPSVTHYSYGEGLHQNISHLQISRNMIKDNFSLLYYVSQ